MGYGSCCNLLLMARVIYELPGQFCENTKRTSHSCRKIYSMSDFHTLYCPAFIAIFSCLMRFSCYKTP